MFKTALIIIGIIVAAIFAIIVLLFILGIFCSCIVSGWISHNEEEKQLIEEMEQCVQHNQSDISTNNLTDLEKQSFNKLVKEFDKNMKLKRNIKHRRNAK